MLSPSGEADSRDSRQKSFGSSFDRSLSMIGLSTFLHLFALALLFISSHGAKISKPLRPEVDLVENAAHLSDSQQRVVAAPVPALAPTLDPTIARRTSEPAPVRGQFKSRSLAKDRADVSAASDGNSRFEPPEPLSPMITADESPIETAAEAKPDMPTEKTEETVKNLEANESPVDDALPESENATSSESVDPASGGQNGVPTESRERSDPPGGRAVDRKQDVSGRETSLLGGQAIDASLRKPISGNPNAVYPQQDRLLHRQGTTLLIGQVNSSGRMSAVKIVQSSGSSSLDRAATDAFERWRFAPGDEALVSKAFRFKLTGQEETVPAKLGSR